jgi:hypothetical protein
MVARKKTESRPFFSSETNSGYERDYLRMAEWLYN